MKNKKVHKVKSHGITPAQKSDRSKSEPEPEPFPVGSPPYFGVRDLAREEPVLAPEDTIEVMRHFEIGGIPSAQRRNITIGDIQKMVYDMAKAGVQEAVQAELDLVKERFHVVPMSAQPAGEDVPDQGPSVASDSYAPTQVIITIRADLADVTPSLVHIANNIRRRMEMDTLDKFPWFDVIHEVTVVPA